MAPKQSRGAAAKAKAKAQAAAGRKVEKKRQRWAALQAFNARVEEVGTGAGQVSKVRAAVNIRFQGRPSKPDTVWTDRGQGFYSPCTGGITAEYKQALKDNRLKPAMGDDASIQPGSLQELALHKTSVAWIRHRLAKSVPTRAWEETRDAYTARLKRVVDDINRNCDVEGLCRAFMTRINKLVERKGGRLSE